MKRREYVSLFLKKLPTPLGEWVTSSYLAKRLARLIAKLASWMMNIQNCQLLVFRLDLRLETLADNLSYSPSPPDWRTYGGKRLTYSPPFVLFYHMGRQSIKSRTTEGMIWVVDELKKLSD